MPWTNGNPPSHIPAPVKRMVRNRQDNQCNTYNPMVCTGQLEEFDHITNIKTLGIERQDANDANNIQGLCKPCHRSKTRAESRAGRSKWKRTPEQHPGLMR